MTMENNSREIFEKWATNRFDGTFDGEGRPLTFDLTRCCGNDSCSKNRCSKTDYKIPVTENAWMIWQEAFKQGFEAKRLEFQFETFQ